MLIVEFSTDIKQLDEWSRRVGVALSVEGLGAPYARAHRHLQAMKLALVSHHGFRELPPSDNRVLFTVECQPPHRSSGGVPRSPTMKLELPIHASSFFSPERRVQWQMVFHSAMWPSLRHTVQPVGDMLHLLQCLMPGLLLVVQVEDGWRTARGLPPADWISQNQTMLVDVLGHPQFKRLHRAASDPTTAFMTAHSWCVPHSSCSLAPCLIFIQRPASTLHPRQKYNGFLSSSFSHHLSILFGFSHVQHASL